MSGQQTVAARKARVAALKKQLVEKEEWTARFIAAMDPVCGAFYRCTALEFFTQAERELDPSLKPPAFAHEP